MEQLRLQLEAALVGSGSLHHASTKGAIRERALAEAFRPYVPERFGLSSGEVTNAEGGTSKQQDLLLVDAQAVPPLFAAGTVGVHPIEAVYAAVEVKSLATSQEITNAVECLASVKSLMSDVPRPYSIFGGGSVGFGERTDKPFTGIIAYELKAKPETLLEAFVTANYRLAPSDRCNALAVPGVLAMTWRDAEGRVEIPELCEHVVVTREEELNSLLVFYSALLHRLTLYQAPEFSLLPYISQPLAEAAVTQLYAGPSEPPWASTTGTATGGLTPGAYRHR